jgi:hypothetical protein
MREWFQSFAESRRRLTESGDFSRLIDGRHELVEGAVLTSVTDLPFEMSFKCTRCKSVFWFENLSWREGGLANWRLNDESEAVARRRCVPAATPLARSRIGHGIGHL